MPDRFARLALVATGVVSCTLLAARGQQPAADVSLAAAPARQLPAGHFPVTTSGAWRVQQTPNFSICWSAAQAIDPALGADFEALRAELCRKWLAAAHVDWRPRCHVVLHPTSASYRRETGAAGGETAGTALVERVAGRVALRRVDLRADLADWRSAAPHELTHVVLADRLAQVQIPRWADEGIATLADTPAKRRLHRADLQRALARGAQLRAIELLTLADPRPEQRAAFYGESLSLVEFLLARGTHATLLDFVEHAARHGYDTALRTHYQIDGIGALERLWLRPG